MTVVGVETGRAFSPAASGKDANVCLRSCCRALMLRRRAVPFHVRSGWLRSPSLALMGICRRVLELRVEQGWVSG